jgi:hypothetical protein
MCGCKGVVVSFVSTTRGARTLQPILLVGSTRFAFRNTKTPQETLFVGLCSTFSQHLFLSLPHSYPPQQTPFSLYTRRTVAKQTPLRLGMPTLHRSHALVRIARHVSTPLWSKHCQSPRVNQLFATATTPIRTPVSDDRLLWTRARFITTYHTAPSIPGIPTGCRAGGLRFEGVHARSKGTTASKQVPFPPPPGLFNTPGSLRRRIKQGLWLGLGLGTVIAAVGIAWSPSFREQTTLYSAGLFRSTATFVTG